ncbi:MAG: 2-succinyl-5-enolpyruvyl-6-hydroxy-3-cyclohexene-1-carboxylic-acid synthase [Archangium sp.]
MRFTLNQRWAATIAGTLAASGVRHVVVAPGSRSTPLALAFADRSDLELWSVMDERAAAFFALGLAKATHTRAAVVCTSGTAGAHFLPAVMEAFEGATPLVVLTADRPWELHGFGAPQTIAQVGMFGRYVIGSEALPSPEENALEHLVAAVSRLLSRGRGPVHLNVPFREPLAHPEGGAGPVIDPYVTHYVTGTPAIDLTSVQWAIAAAKRGVIVCGPRERNDDFGAWIHQLSRDTGFPVLAEAASNARFGFTDSISFFDTLLRNPRFAETMRPDVVLRFGGGLTPKIPQQWLDASGAKQFHFTDDGFQFDPVHRSTMLLPFTRALHFEGTPTAEQRAYKDTWLEGQRQVSAALSEQPPEFTEPLIAREFIASCPEGTNVFMSSSMPIRDVDAFATSSKSLRVFVNRGVNGIDGITSTALGVAAGSGKPTALLIGDVALLHDLTAWLIARRHEISLTVLVVNNDGGGIFHFLPVAERTPHFENLFGTPHGVDLAHVAALAGAKLHRPADMNELRKTMGTCLEGGLHLIEVKTERRANVVDHRALFTKLTEAMS